MEAGVDVGVGFQPFDETGDPGAGHHDADGCCCTFGESGYGAFVGFEGHAGVVDVEDENAGAFGEAEAVSVSGVCGAGGLGDLGGQQEWEQ